MLVSRARAADALCGTSGRTTIFSLRSIPPRAGRGVPRLHSNFSSMFSISSVGCDVRRASGRCELEISARPTNRPSEHTTNMMMQPAAMRNTVFLILAFVISLAGTSSALRYIFYLRLAGWRLCL